MDQKTKNKQNASTVLRSLVRRVRHSARTLQDRLNIKTEHIVEFTDNLSSLIAAGVSLVQAMEIIRSETDNRSMRRLIGELKISIEEGNPLSQSLARYPHIFKEVWISIIQVGELSGNLSEVLREVSDGLQRDLELKNKVTGAMVYPAIVVVGMIIVTFIMLVAILPQVTSFLNEFEAPLPLPTKILVAISRTAQQYWPAIIAGCLTVAYLFRLFFRSRPGRPIYARILLSLPVMGLLNKHYILHRFCRHLSTLIRSGVPILNALELMPATTGNTLYQGALTDISQRIETGSTLHDALHAYPSLFPPIMVQMTHVSEETGMMDDALAKLAIYYQRKIDKTVRTISQIVEPILMAVIGLGVAFLALAVISPIYTLVGSIQ